MFVRWQTLLLEFLLKSELRKNGAEQNGGCTAWRRLIASCISGTDEARHCSDLAYAADIV